MHLWASELEHINRGVADRHLRSEYFVWCEGFHNSGGTWRDWRGKGDIQGPGAWMDRSADPASLPNRQ